MMNETGIVYLSHTWSPATGCTFACPECWARDVAQNRLAPALEKSKNKEFLYQTIQAYKTFKPTLHSKRLSEPYKRKKHAVVGVCFMGELFDPALSDDARAEIHAVMLVNKQHTYILLTKRPELMADYYALQGPDEGEGAPDIYLGFSARTQAEFNAGWPHMAKLAAAGWKVWVSLEPMQEAIDLGDCKSICGSGECPPLIHNSLHGSCRQERDFVGVVLGAQSGKDAPALDLDWVRSVRDQCAAAGVPFMYKQGPGDHGPVLRKSPPRLDGVLHKALAWQLQK